MKLRKKKPIGKQAVIYIEQLYAQYSRKLFLAAMGYVKNAETAQDIVQTVFEKALLYPNSLLRVPENEAYYFLTAMMKNAAFTAMEEERNNAHESLTYEDGEEGDFVEDPENNYIQMIDLQSLKEKFQKLPEQNRDILLFRYVYGFKCKEIADMFHFSERTIKFRCSEGREMLKELLIKDDEYFEA